MPWWATLILVAIAVFVLDRLLLWAEVRGWIFYRKRKPTGGGSAMLGVANELFHPAQHNAVQELEQEVRRIYELGNEDPLDKDEKPRID